MLKKTVKHFLKKLDLEVNNLQPKDDSDLYKSLFDAESLQQQRFYNICAGGHIGFGGGFNHPYWTNIDVESDWTDRSCYNPDRDIFHDLLDIRDLPVDSESAELVHSRFAIEHITDEAAENFFQEVYRILKKDGVFRIVVPNVDLDYRAYLRGDLSYFCWRNMFSSKSACNHLKYAVPLNKASIE